jgi:hypothetical protein
LNVTLKSGSNSASVPKSLTVSAGSSTATFSVGTQAVSFATTAKITATYGPTSFSATLTIDPIALAGLSVNPSELIGGGASTGTVWLNGPAPAQGLTVSLSSSQTSISVLGNVTISGGATTATFAISTQKVSSAVSGTITASLLGFSYSSTLKVDPDPISSLTVNPSTLVGGTTSLATVALSVAAPAGGLTVALNSNQAAATVPTAVTVPAGAATATFNISTLPVAAQTVATITASVSSTSVSTTLTISAPSLTGLTLNPATVGGGIASAGTVTLSGPAPSGGFVVTLSSNKAQATVPASVTVAAGTSSASFSVNTAAVSAQVLATITATDPAGIAQTAQLTIQMQATQSVQIIDIPVNSIVYDSVSGNIWATVQSTGGQYANSIVAINPLTGKIGVSIDMGAEPNNIAVTDDGQFAYVDVKADGTIRRANLWTGTRDSIFTDGIGGVFDVEAVPGSPHSYVVVTNPVYGVNTTVWDDAVQRPGVAAGGYDVRFAGNNSSLMFGDGQPSYFIDTLTSDSISWSQVGIPVNGMVWANNLLYTAIPTVVDPLNKYVVESIPTTDFLSSTLVTASTTDNRIYYVTWDATHNKRLLDFDINTYSEYPWFDTGSIPGGCQHMIACGNHTVAFYIFGYNVPQNVVIVRNLK